MFRRIAILLLLVGIWATPSLAQTAARCAPYQEQSVATDLEIATRMAASAAAAVGDTETFATWFGTYTDRNAEQVRAVLKQVHAKLLSQRLALTCATKSDQTCQEAFAWVFPASGVIRLCPDYFFLPSMERAHAGEDINLGSREGALIHEISHAVSGTDDDCITWADCRTLARRSPATAILSANSYESFAEDVMLQLMAAAETVAPPM
ncbi:putative protease precursor [Rubellimicrobium mesophilum DSM 19309]|uniref:Putative protease n=1 Tax=Rubellimicrobium mesophilum DSM 19309 TaxID=442562 RepID=A0A017HPX0_9RHOB|nr:M35 family metallo-endopeptidase [Rubellimicrobium mesophilum]EYD76421.1 putative protease precursor [Rubellimicrobium mesophilum DSM 19309]